MKSFIFNIAMMKNLGIGCKYLLRRQLKPSYKDMSTSAAADAEHLLKIVKAVTDKPSLKESQRAYDDWADTYEKDYLTCGYSGHVMVSDRVCEKFQAEKRPHVRVLDVGAGTGLVAKELRKHGFKHIDALEPNEKMQYKARELNLYENYFQMFITGTPLDIPADSYDAVTGSGIFGTEWHVPCEAVIEMIRLVKPGGYVVLSARHNLLQQTEQYKLLDPLMDRLEAEGKWKKESREICPRFYLDIEGIIWCYKVL